jgi:hypothetical protein
MTSASSGVAIAAGICAMALFGNINPANDSARKERSE